MRLRLGDVEHDLTTRALVMGVLDRTPSYFDADAGVSLDAVLGRADEAVGHGADLLDVGGVRAGPGPPVGEEEELERVVPVVRALRARFDVPLSVDTWRSRVLAEACTAGVAVGNDVSGFVDPEYLPVASQGGASVVVTHTRLQGEPDDVVAAVRAFLADHVARANAAGIPDERIIVDAGLDLGKSPAQSLRLLRESAAVADLGPPLLVNASEKRFLGMLLDLDVEGRRLAGHAAAALGVARGCRIVRAHDVRGAKRVAAVLDALLSARLAHVVGGGPG